MKVMFCRLQLRRRRRQWWRQWRPATGCWTAPTTMTTSTSLGRLSRSSLQLGLSNGRSFLFRSIWTKCLCWEFLCIKFFCWLMSPGKVVELKPPTWACAARHHEDPRGPPGFHDCCSIWGGISRFWWLLHCFLFVCHDDQLFSWTTLTHLSSTGLKLSQAMVQVLKISLRWSWWLQ